ncbi:MAG TPA: HD domain-containing phosphohydrolase [Bacteriovoracaceae bacterium]|nr:HD domain-containing phosphohydrolase [Bacteriovoracaceae bacterium]
MSQTILIESNPDLNKIFSINLNTFVGTDVIVRKNADDALALLRILPQVSLIITKAKVDSEETALKIFRYLKEEGSNTSMIVMGACPSISSEVLCLGDPVSWETLIKEAAKHLGVTLEEVSNKPGPDYLPIGLYYFFDIQSTPCDVYIRIKKGPNDYQFVKRIHQKDIFDKATIQKYEDQGLKEFFIPKDYIQYFTTFVTNNLIEKLERSDLTIEERILTTSNGHEIVRDRIHLMELDQDSIDLSDASINSMMKSVKDSPEVANLLKFLFSNKVSYAYQHCHLLALMCHYVLSKQSWYKAEHLQVLSFVSFFADVTLKSPQQMQITSMRDLSESTLTEDEKYQVMNHAADAVEILDDHPEFNEYIKTVLLQSHGKMDGIGFEDNPGEDLHPLSKVFVVADSFVKVLLNPVMPKSKKEILPILVARFTNPSYQKIIKTLEQKF